jgi:hypothetical protein
MDPHGSAWIRMERDGQTADMPHGGGLQPCFLQLPRPIWYETSLLDQLLAHREAQPSSATRGRRAVAWPSPRDSHSAATTQIALVLDQSDKASHLTLRLALIRQMRDRVKVEGIDADQCRSGGGCHIASHHTVAVCCSASRAFAKGAAGHSLSASPRGV